MKESDELNKYYLEFKFTKKQHIDQWNSPKAKLEDLFFSLHEDLALDRITERNRFIPHITFITPFKTKNINDIIISLDNRFRVEDFKPEEIYFTFDKINIFPHDSKEYLVLLAEPSPRTIDLQKKIKINTTYNRNVKIITEEQIYDWNPHIEIGDSSQIKDMTKAKRFAEKYIQDENIYGLREIVSRITIIEKKNKQSHIYAEYDFFQKKWFNRYEALTNKYWKETAELNNKEYIKLNKDLLNK